MKQTTIWIVLLGLLLLGLIALDLAMETDQEVRNYEIMPNMVESIARDGQSTNDLREVGILIDFRPPEGSIARGYQPLGFAATPEGALLAGGELESPIAIDDATALTRGAKVFGTFCAVCHGPGGLGDGGVTKRGVPPPPSLLLPHALEMKDGQMFHLISLGQGNMASYASQVERIDRWRAIRYVRSLQEADQP